MSGRGGGPAFRGGNGTTEGNGAHTETGLSPTRNSKTRRGSLVLRLIWRSLEFRVRSCEEKSFSFKRFSSSIKNIGFRLDAA